MHDQNALQLLAKVMNWEDIDSSHLLVPKLQLLASFKYDQYQQFGPGRRFIESLALWLRQFDDDDRPAALKLVSDRLVYVSDLEIIHLVTMAYPDLILDEHMRLVAEEHDIPSHRVAKITRHKRFEELKRKSLYLGLSDGARTNELRRASRGGINNEQIWHAYELSDEKAQDMLKELSESLNDLGLTSVNPRFNLIWLIDDFSGSGNTYIRYDNEAKQYKGKIKKVFERLHQGDLIDTDHYEVYLLLYVATQQAIDHIEYWSERFTSENGYKPIQLRVLCPIGPEISLSNDSDSEIALLLNKAATNNNYYDDKATDRHILVGGTEDARLGFAGCALPLVLSHNSPNNSIYLLWGPEFFEFSGLFPRVSRHREF